MDESYIPAQHKSLGSAFPAVMVTGWTASGKTTLVEHLARTGLRRITASKLLIKRLGETQSTKMERLLSWLASDLPTLREGEADRLTDLAVLRRLTTRDEGCVVESAGSVSLLLPPYNEALLVRLDATPQVRTERLGRLLTGRITAVEAALIVERKDAATAHACQQAWGLNLNDATYLHRYDVIVGCPDERTCANPQLCRSATSEVVIASYQVYRTLLGADRHATAIAVDRLNETAERLSPWVYRLGPSLTAPDPRQDWTSRMAHHDFDIDVPRRGASC
ncbi:hypothetical protein [Actinoplanes couchii]|uniref:NadR/Ttd14 AAA domain-containing protein n=1 Tax=Actinoplanes couchii TaxID=403638 RepID=A0ABQ3XL82_9ACTN|nr:hypothetical protein [Actinoplanes couchii]MDR6318379.1 cytidylate kinase [Actinoplanes couchii]GID59254.1 hypothetical protein Aco03nite_076580 [Actinoplanes couchii]